MEWVRGKKIGVGSFSSVYLATPKGGFSQLPPLMAVKSSSSSQSDLLQQEKQILTQFADCPEIIECLGESHTLEGGERYYNVLLEFASRGNLAELVKKSGGSIAESEVKIYTRSVLKGLRRIHDKGFVHCDVKLQNLLVCDGNQVKIGDFGLAKKMGEEKNKSSIRGTPLYMSPESISRNEQEPPMDIWALGCVVAEMISGKPAWRCKTGTDVSALLFRIGFNEELPEIPKNMSQEGKDFLQNCLVRDPKKRWTAAMLLNHPFVADVTVPLPDCGVLSPSPRSAFEFPDWSSSSMASDFNQWGSSSSCSDSDDDQILRLATKNQPNWDCCTDSWIMVREGRIESSVLDKNEKMINPTALI